MWIAAGLVTCRTPYSALVPADDYGPARDRAIVTLLVV